MRSLLRAALGAAVALSAVAVPFVGTAPAVAAASAPKVVIVVGPVGSTTPSYRSDSDAAAAEAAKYTSNVVKLYSPNATWDAVKSALQGASIVVYMGHGNGFPSPYSTTLQPDRQDGFGLNPTAGVDDSATQYWGEQYLESDIHLAPNAVVILGHLCYASGSSEPGRTDPTEAVAKQRVDNFAAGFLAAGARAVIAEAYNGAAAGYIDTLFTGHTTAGAMWASSSTKQGNTFSFASTRTPGMTVQMDPDHSSGKYWRAITGDMSLSTDAVVSGDGSTPAPSPTPSGPGSSPGPTPTPSPTPTPTPTPSPSATDDTAKVDLTSAGIALTSISAPAAFSPNGDGLDDTFPIHAVLSSPATWQLTISDAAGAIYLSTGGLGSTIDVDWDGTSGGSHLRDGIYTYRLSASDGVGGVLDRTARVRIDTTPPVLTATTPVAPAAFSPNGDGSADTWTGTYAVSEPATATATILNSAGNAVRHLTAASSGGTVKLTWDGRSDTGAGVADGQYTLTYRATDAAGNAGASNAVSLTVYRALARVTASTTLFYPQDGDALAPSTTLGFTLVAPATVTWTIVDAKGQVVATQLASVALPAGTQAWTWAGVDGTGHPVAPGAYTAVITATNGTLSITSRTALTVAAFRLSVSPSAAVRGGNVTVTAVSAETLSGPPRLTLTQPGQAARSVAMVRVAASTYRVTTRLATGGGTGTLTLKVAGTDAAGGTNIATVAVPLK